jgi:hypothetical protein
MNLVIKTVVLILFIISAFAIEGKAQGCSDAGFCSINGVKPLNNDDDDSLKLMNSLTAGVSVGNTRYDVWIITSYLEYSRYLTQKWIVSLKMSGEYRSGSFTNLTGFSDAFLTTAYAFPSDFTLIAGVKIPFNDANKSNEQRSMPMAYQTSLGTYDGILGLRYKEKNWSFTTAWQQPIIQNNNHFLMENYTVEELGHIYPNTNLYQRAGDVLLRISYEHLLKRKFKKLKLVYSLLPIYHLSDDFYTDKSNNSVELNGSEGLTLNVNTFANYAFNSESALGLSVGFPLIAREVRPEGLNQFALTLEFIKNF